MFKVSSLYTDTLFMSFWHACTYCLTKPPIIINFIQRFFDEKLQRRETSEFSNTLYIPICNKARVMCSFASTLPSCESILKLCPYIFATDLTETEMQQLTNIYMLYLAGLTPGIHSAFILMMTCPS